MSEALSMGTGGGRPIELVRDGMHVVDADGEEVGTVKEVVLGDPGAETAVEPPETPNVAVVGIPAGTAGPAGPAAATFGLGAVGSDLPEVERSRLLRTGYVRINLKGLFSGHRYAAGDEIADVVGDAVRLTVPAARLVG